MTSKEIITIILGVSVVLTTIALYITNKIINHNKEKVMRKKAKEYIEEVLNNG